MKLAITGAGGLLGSALLKKAEGHEVYSLYNRHLPSSGVPINVDLQDQSQTIATLQRIKPDAIIHTAAVTDVDRCEKERDLANAVNHETTKSIASCARDLGAFVAYVSTDYVFDGKRGMYNENDEPMPVNFYGLTKLRGELAVKELAAEYLIARTSVIYGSTPSSGKVNFALWVLNALKESKEVTVTSDQFVSPTLNTNLAEMIMECLERRLTGTFHLAGATRLSRVDFATEICRVWSLNPSLIKPVEMSEMKWYAKRPKDSSLDVTKAASILRRGPATVARSLQILKEELDANPGVGGSK